MRRIACVLLLAWAALATVSGFELDFEAAGTRVEEESVSFLELELSLGAAPQFEPSSHYATLAPHITHAQAHLHCNTTNKAYTLCAHTALCPKGQPLGGARSHRALVPIKHEKPNQWLSVGSVRACEVVDGEKWGTTETYKSFKGLVACCDASGVVIQTTLSQFEGFIIKRPDLSSVFMVEGGVRRSIPSAKSFEAMGFHFNRILVLPVETVEAIPLGKSLPDYSGKPKNSHLFKHALLGYEHEGGSPFELYEGFLIKKASSPIICMIEALSKRCVPNAETFSALGFDWNLVQVVSDALYDAFREAEPFPDRKGAAENSEPFVHALLGKDHFGVQSLRQTAVEPAQFVESAVRRVLDRAPTPAEKEALLLKLRAKNHVPTLIEHLVSSNAFQSRWVYPELIAAIYQQVLERKPTEDERKQLLDYFQKVHRSGDPTKNVKQVVARFALSEEHQTRFVTKAGVSAEQVVRSLYRHILGREPENEAVVRGHAAQAEKKGWKATIQSFIDSAEYKQNVGLYGVPGHAAVYAAPIKALYKKLLNVDPAKLVASQLSSECLDARKYGWRSYTEEFLKRKEYMDENGAAAFMDEQDRVISLIKDEPKKK